MMIKADLIHTKVKIKRFPARQPIVKQVKESYYQCDEAGRCEWVRTCPSAALLMELVSFLHFRASQLGSSVLEPNLDIKQVTP